MDAQTLLQTIDVWCQWDTTFGEHAQELRSYFTIHHDMLQAILLRMIVTRGRKPTKKWLREWTELKASVPVPLLRHFLIGLAAKREWYKGCANEAEARMLNACESGRPIPPTASCEYGTINIYGASAYSEDGSMRWRKQGAIWYTRLPEEVIEPTFRIAYGACWALADFPDLQTRDLVMSLIRVRHFQPAIWTMAQWGDEDAVARLLQIQRDTTHKAVLASIENVLLDIANQRGMTMDELKDRAIFTYGLNVQGERVWHVGEYTLRLAISPGGLVQRSVRGPDGKVVREPPPELRQAWSFMVGEANMLSKTLSMQKRRLEAAMKERRGWSWAEWQSTVASNLISKRLAYRLVWNISGPDDTHYAYTFFDSQRGWHDVRGEAVVIRDEHRIHIAHPVEMTPEEHSSWQRYIVTHKITQPFKQMFRETYVLTPAEEETRTYSNRFATHVVPSKIVHAPASRGWEVRAVCWHDFQRHNIRAYLWIEHTRSYTHNILQQIAFYPLDHTMLWSQPRLDLDPACLPLRDIPPVIFSEVMRDLDQCLVSASEGTSAQWEEENRTPSQVMYDNQAEQRELLLHDLLPLLGLGPTVQIEGSFAHIDGQRCRYKIDLGNGTIYTEPGGRYLCIVPRFDQQKLYLPFEESDPKTAEILSKILLLADDGSITDASILRQLPAKLVH